MASLWVLVVVPALLALTLSPAVAALPLGAVCPAACNCSRVVSLGNSPQNCSVGSGEGPGLMVACDGHRLEQIPSDIPLSTTLLFLSYNNLTSLPNNSFRGLSNLTWLYLSHNHIHRIDPDAFAGLDKLCILSLRGNRLPLSPRAYHPRVFQPLVSLVSLHLDKNVVTPPRSSLHPSEDPPLSKNKDQRVLEVEGPPVSTNNDQRVLEVEGPPVSTNNDQRVLEGLPVSTNNDQRVLEGPPVSTNNDQRVLEGLPVSTNNDQRMLEGLPVSTNNDQRVQPSRSSLHPPEDPQLSKNDQKALLFRSERGEGEYSKEIRSRDADIKHFNHDGITGSHASPGTESREVDRRQSNHDYITMTPASPGAENGDQRGAEDYREADMDYPRGADQRGAEDYREADMDYPRGADQRGAEDYREEDMDYPAEALANVPSVKRLFMDGLANRSLGPAFRNMTALIRLSLSGLNGRCSLGVLTPATFANVPHLEILNISYCGIADVLPGTFSAFRKLHSLDVSYNFEQGLDLLPKVTQSLGEVDLRELFMNAIVPPSSLPVTVEERHLRYLGNLTALTYLTAKFNRLARFTEGLLCTAVPASLIKVYAEANLFQLEPWVNDLRCLPGLNLLVVNGYDRYYSPFLHPPPLPHHPLPLCHNGQPCRGNTLGNADSGEEAQRHMTLDEDREYLIRSIEVVPAETDNDLHVIDEDSQDSTAREPFFQDRESNGDEEEEKEEEINREISDSYRQRKRRHYSLGGEILCDGAREKNAPTTEFYLAPNLTTFKVRHFGLFYKLGNISVHPDNSLRLLDAGENHLWDWCGPIRGLENLTHLWMSGTSATYISRTFFQGFPGLEELDLSKNDLRSVFYDDPHGHVFRGLGKLTSLNLADNDLGRMHNQSLIHLRSLENVTLSVNGMATFDVSLGHMTRLQHVDLSENQLQTLPRHVRDHLDAVAEDFNVTVNMRYNPIACTCGNLEFVKWIHHSKVEFGPFVNYYCQMTDGSKVRSLTDIVAEAAELERTCGSFVGVFVGASACFVMLVTLLLGALVYRYRWKLRYLWYASRLALRRGNVNNHPQQRQQQQEQFHYDAFVSFATDDQDFVMGELKSRLEDERGLALCIHTRDFMPGQYIASNIVDSVQRSRRTLVVMTRALLESNWCHYELQMALMEGASTGRDVPLFLLYEHVPAAELSRDMLANLKATSYTEFPHGEDDRQPFWDMLARALRA